MALDAANAKAAADAVRFASAEQTWRERVESAEARAREAETSAVELRNRCVLARIWFFPLFFGC
jgi:hypothetical protein